MTADINRLMAFASATISDDDVPIPDAVRAAGRQARDAHPAPGSGWQALSDTGLHRQVMAWLGRTGELAQYDHRTLGTVLAFSPPDCMANPFVGISGPRVPARFAYHSASPEHLVLQFETMADFWIGEAGREVLLVVPSSETGGLLCSRLRIEHGCLGHDQRLRYTFACLTTEAAARAA